MRQTLKQPVLRTMGIFLLIGVLLVVSSPMAMAQESQDQRSLDSWYETLERVIEIMARDALYPVDEDTLIQAAIYGAVGALNDRYGAFISPAEFQFMMQRYENSRYGGIGVRVTSSPQGAYILEVFPDSPAAEVGLRSGDIIIRVDGETVEGLPLDQIVERVRGPRHSQVSIEYLRDEQIVGPIELTREQVITPTISSQAVVIDDQTLGYISIREFAESTAEEFARALSRLSHADALLVDLRGNPGGLLVSSIDTAAHVVPAGPILETHGREGLIQRYERDSVGVDVPLTILVDTSTASGAEIFAGVARERAQALIVGMNTYGKGTVQSLYDVDGTGLRFTTAEYLLPSGYRINGRGLEPDIMISRGGDTYPSARYVTFEIEFGFGDVGEEVEALESRLQLLGYLTGSPDETFDGQTLRALMRFQMDQQLPVLGRADRATLERLVALTGSIDSPLEYPELDMEDFSERHPGLGQDAQLLQALRVLLGFAAQSR